MEKQARDGYQRKVKSNELVSPEMRKQILRLREELCECESGISNHCNDIEEVHRKLATALECVECLLSEDPFEAWKDYAQREEEEDDAFLELEDCVRPSAKGNKKKLRKTHLATTNVTKLITPEMCRRIHKLKSQLEEYAACVRQALHDLEPESLGAALELGYSLGAVDSLESPEARRKREKEAADQDEEPLDSL